MTTTDSTFDFLVIGGGIGGVTCVETLSQLSPSSRVGLVSASGIVKVARNIRPLTKLLEEFNVEEEAADDFRSRWPNVEMIQDVVSKVDAANHTVHFGGSGQVQYRRLCLASGGRPKLIAKEHPLVIGIRDTESVDEFQKKLKGARRIMVVGNGGIATELVHEVKGCQVVWAIKHSSISATFMDPVAGEFFLKTMKEKDHQVETLSSQTSEPMKRLNYDISGRPYTLSRVVASGGPMGGALGPDWAAGLQLKGQERDGDLKVIYHVEVDSLLSPAEVGPSGEEGWPVYVRLTDGSVTGCDLVVSATGVVPNVDWILEGNDLNVATQDGGLLVDDQMRTSQPDIYAVGDCCTANWTPAEHWFQMRLWGQARQMGAQAARCMLGHSQGEVSIYQDFCFELFTHVTNFFNFKVVLLGRYNGQGLDLTSPDCELLMRVTPGQEFIKCVMQKGRMQGCVLIGQTDMEETFENLILNQTDLSPFMDDLLNPNIDIEDYFD